MGASTAAAAADGAIERALAAGDTLGAARLTFDAYGSAVLSFLLALLGEQTATQAALAHFGDQLWRGRETGADDGYSVRCWVYRLAWKSALRVLNGELPASPSPGAARDAARTESSEHTRLDPRLLRDFLASDEQMLLILRVDRGLAYGELARVVHGPLSGPQLASASEALKQRFQIVKAELRKWAGGTPARTRRV